MLKEKTGSKSENENEKKRHLPTLPLLNLILTGIIRSKVYRDFAQ